MSKKFKNLKKETCLISICLFFIQFFYFQFTKIVIVKWDIDMRKSITNTWASQVLSGKESTCQCRKWVFDQRVRKIPWRRKWQPTPVLLTGESHGERSPAGYSPCVGDESDTTEWPSTRTHALILTSVTSLRDTI